MTITGSFAFDSQFLVLVTVLRDDGKSDETIVPCRTYDGALRTEKAVHDADSEIRHSLTRIYELRRP